MFLICFANKRLRFWILQGLVKKTKGPPGSPSRSIFIQELEARTTTGVSFWRKKIKRKPLAEFPNQKPGPRIAPSMALKQDIKDGHPGGAINTSRHREEAALSPPWKVLLSP